jgi:hypothetical protein
MATISNTPRPGYVWDSTDNVWYPIGVGGHSHGEIPATIADAKGDLIVGTAADTVDRLAVGADATILVADSAEATGLKWAAPSGASYTWTSYTPTITSQGGSITTYTATGKYLKIDKGMFFIFTVTLSNVGTATGNMIITLPFTAVGSSAGSAYEYNTTGKGGPVSIANNASVATSRDSTFTTWFSNGWNLYASIFLSNVLPVW